jgi:hypothetical protein
MATVVCLIAVTSETLVAVREVRTMRVGPATFSPAVIATFSKDGKGAERALPLQILEPSTREELKAARESLLKQINAYFDTYEAQL